MGGTNLYGQSGNSVAPILFGCIDFYSVECAYDVNGEEGKITQGTIDIGGQGGVGQASYSKAMRAFAQCAEANMERPGYCHGSLSSAETLRNGDVCQGGASVRRRYSLGLTALSCLATSNRERPLRRPTLASTSGFRLWLTCRARSKCSSLGFRESAASKCSQLLCSNFRMHADFGRGGYIGVDGATFTGGNIYSHVQTGPVSLSAGEHEFEALGFEDCCDATLSN